MRARRALTVVAITTGLVLTVAGCGGGDDGGKKKTDTQSTTSSKGGGNKEEPEEQAEDKVLAEVTGGEGVTLTINSAVRDQGGFLTVSGKVRNGGSGRWVANSWRGEEQELQRNAASMAGASIVDKAGKKRYLILRDTEGRCLCTTFTPFKQGEEKTWYAQFPAPPDSATNVTFQIADMPPATIEISEGE
ncbi:hypothetical protein ACFQVC_13355 [Streptomyces monticola]|uniref:Secreted protein n=1 Tax=Streptomyces monticola TaxID=2666263 RepID=A0ABW2JGT6_9ACTN